MTSDDYDDPSVEAAWLAKQRVRVGEYLRAQQVPFGSVADRPGWHLAPYVAVWPALGKRTGHLQYWVIVGDLPADFLPGDAAPDPRGAVAAFAARWQQLAQGMLEGRPHQTLEVGGAEQQAELGDLLLRRANLLAEFAREDEHW
jgi:hypothetical protein